MYKESMKIWNRHEAVLAGASTYSKSPHRFPFGAYPIFMSRGEGCHVWDVDGNKYIDWTSGLGPIILGYKYPKVDKAIKKQLKKGISFSLLHPLEVELAELLTEMLPYDNAIFCKNGSDATSAAVRLARAYTGRDKIAWCSPSYHGWGSWFAISQPIHKGVPSCLKDTIIPFQYNDIESLKKVFDEHDDIAAVITEPVIYDRPVDHFLKDVAALTHKHGALLIYDMIVTFPRFGGFGGKMVNNPPDLVCVGKAIGNGMPISAVVGDEKVMRLRRDEEIFFSGTFFGETLSMAAAIATLKEVRDKDVPSHIHSVGERLKDGYNELAKELNVNTKIKGLPMRTVFKFDDLECKSLFFQECANRGVLWGNVTFPNFSHNGHDIDKTLDVCHSALSLLKKAIEEDNVRGYLRGRVMKTIAIREEKEDDKGKSD